MQLAEINRIQPYSIKQVVRTLYIFMEIVAFESRAHCPSFYAKIISKSS